MNNEKKTGAEKTEEDLVEAYRSGDAAALNELMNRCQPLISGIAGKYSLPDGEADDLLQEGRIGLFKAVEKYDGTRDTKFSTYAYMCIQNEIRHAVQRSNAMYNLLLTRADSLTNAQGENIEIEDPVEHNPEHIVVSDEHARETYAAIKKSLSAFEQEVLDMYMDGAKYTEIAQTMDLDPKVIDNALQRIRRKAKAAIKKAQ
ncbi:MAG: sigma-70 family RNA polymerase sigma factor [Lachnospiraceae bacterium]|nr:sigma-70 family RNA polymerase sigma factor [Lachnospiraceae bacterium]